MNLKFPGSFINLKPLASKTFLFFVLPLLLLISAPLLLFVNGIDDEIEDNRSYVHYNHSSASAAHIDQFLSRFELVTIALARNCKDVKAIFNAPKIDGELLKKLEGAIAESFPESVGIILTINGEPYTIPSLDDACPLSNRENALELLKSCEPNEADANYVFCWSKPFLWNDFQRCIAGVCTMYEGDSKAYLGIIIPLERIRSRTQEITQGFGSVAGTVLFDRVSGKLWYPDSVVEIAVTGELSDTDRDAAIKTLVAETMQIPTGSQLNVPFDENLSAYFHSLITRKLGLLVFYTKTEKTFWLKHRILTATVILFLIWISVVTVALLSEKKIISILTDTRNAFREHVAGRPLPNPPVSMPEEGELLYRDMREYSKELSRRDKVLGDQIDNYSVSIAKLKEIVKTMPYGYVLTNSTGEIVDFNEAMVKMCGYSTISFTKMNISELLQTNTVPLGWVDEKGTEFSPPSLMLKNSKGEVMPISLTEKRVMFGTDTYILCIIRNISREEEIRKTLLETTSKLENSFSQSSRQLEEYRLEQKKLLNQLQEGLLVVDEAGNIVDSNAAAADLTIFPAAKELIGVNFFTDLNASDFETGLLDKFMNKEEVSFPVRISFDRFDGTKGFGDVIGTWSESRGRKLADILIKDVTNEESLRQQLESHRSQTESILRQHEEEMKETQAQMIDHAHRAGMAEVASEILHNIGNAVNSIGVRLREGIERNLKNENLPVRLGMISQLVEKEGLTPQQKHEAIQKYVPALADAVDKSRNSLFSSVSFIMEKLDHISEIISFQQSIAAIRGIIETVQVSELVSDAVEMNRESILKRDIQVKFRFGDVPPVRVEKNKLLQVLVNLIKNSFQAIDHGDGKKKEIAVEVDFLSDRKMVKISIADSGVGITEKTLKELFKFGFTTKKRGSGFGLHSSSNLMKAMGGEIQVASDGKYMGATFTLFLPISPPLQSRGDDDEEDENDDPKPLEELSPAEK